jgi:hypothetical protein
MEGSTGITPVMPVGNNYGDGFGFGGSGLWLFAILALMWGGNGFFGGNNAYGLGYRQATAEDVNNGFNFSELQAETRDILGAISSDTASTIAAVERVGAGITSDIHDVAMGVAQTQAHQQECCCNILRAVDGVNYNGALNTAAINANTTAQTQRILDALAQDKSERQQARIQQLELSQALAGVVRYPSAMTYGAGPSPFCSGCGCGNI